ncbi:unnamed protein product, partial [Prorocentrum cordatum]
GGRTGGIAEARTYRFRRLPTPAELWAALRRGAAEGFGVLPASPFKLDLSAANCEGRPAGPLEVAGPVAALAPAVALAGAAAAPAAAEPAAAGGPPLAAAAVVPAAPEGAAAAAPGRAPAVPDGAPVAPLSSGAAPPGWLWVAAEDVDGLAAYGEELQVGVAGGVQLAWRSGRRGGFLLPAGGAAFGVLLQHSEVAYFRQEFRGNDARTLEGPAAAAASSGPARDWREVVQLCHQEQMADFAVPGPRTAAWCAKYQVKEELLDTASKDLERISSIKKNARKLRGEQAAAAKGELLTELVVALNQLDAGSDLVRRQCEGEPSRMQQLCLERLAESCAEIGAPPSDLSSEVALRELQVGTAYGGCDPVSVAPFVHDLVSLPAVGGALVPLDQLLGKDGPDIVRRFISSKVLSSHDAAEAKKDSGFARPYLDPVLRRREDYLAFIRRLGKANMLDFRLDGGDFEEVGLFTVWKKDGRQRLVIDCRGSSLHFAEPNKTSFASGASFSRMELQEGEQLWTGGVDIADAFYNMGLPGELRRYFALSRLRAADLGVEVVEGQSVSSRAWVRPCLAVLPMGWSHALDFCQRVHRSIVLEKGGLPGAAEIIDGRPPADVREGASTAYVDNFVAFGTGPERPGEMLDAARKALEGVGLPAHPTETPVTVSEQLGWVFDGEREALRPKSRRVWRLRLGILELLKKGYATGRQIGKVAGHYAFIALAQRPMLSVFSAVYSFSRKYFSRVMKIPPSEPEIVDDFEGGSSEGERWKVQEVSGELYGGRWQAVSSGGVQASARWIPSERNVADAPSRGWTGARAVLSRTSTAGTCGAGASAASAPMSRQRGRSSTSWPSVGPPAAPSGAPGAPRRLRGKRAADGGDPVLSAVRRPRHVGAAAAAARRQVRAAPARGAARADRRRARAAPLVTGGAILQGASATPQTVAQCDALWQDILRAWAATACKAGAARVPSDEDMDGLLASWMDRERLACELSQRGAKAMAAVKFFRPQFSRAGGLSLPRAAQALKGWKRLAPGRARLPLPWEVVSLIALELVAAGFWAMAAWVAITSHCYLRPSELGRATPEMIIAPTPGTHISSWAIVLRPSEEEVSSKTREFDETVVFDLAEFSFLHSVLAFLKRSAPPRQPVFGFLRADLARHFRAAAARAE